jgi:succinoglycan biosynthesis transport protein ExoP
MIASFIVLALVLAVIYVALTPPRYSASSQLLLDTRRLQVLQQQSIMSELSFDAAVVDSQLEILKSEAIAQDVVRRFDLAEDPEFTAGGQSPLGWVRSGILQLVNWWTGYVPEPPTEDMIVQRAIDYLGANLTIQRVGRSNVIEISFQSLDPGKAVGIANALGEAYISDQLGAKYTATKRAADWLKERSEELGREAEVADRAALNFRNKHSLTDADGKLLSDQQLAEVSAQLTVAKSHTAEAKARLERILEVSKSGIEDPAVSDSLQNAVLNRLQQDYIDAAKREADFSSRYGQDHPAAVNLRKEMRQIQEVSKSEINRIAESYKSEYEIARTREQALQVRLDKLTQESAEAREAQLRLRVLENSANTYRALHSNYLEKFVEATQQQSLPSTEARLITTAMVARQTHPQIQFVLTLACLFGASVGCMVAFAREGFNRTFRATSEVEAALGLRCLGVIPAPAGKPRRQPIWTSLLKGDPPEMRRATDAMSVTRQVIHAPFSRFAETIRSIKVAVDTSTVVRDIKVIGITSALPKEGKSTVASSLAQLMAHSGRQILLIDADLRNPSLTRQIAPRAKLGIMDVLEGRAELDEVIRHDALTGFNFLPAVVQSSTVHTNEILSSDKMAGLLSLARDRYEFIIMDFPPIAPVVDAKAAAHHVDAFILVVEWGRTLPEAIYEALGAADVVHNKILGVVLNKADAKTLKRLESYKGENYHSYHQLDV